MTAAVTVTWPVHLRVGDMPENPIGEITADSAGEAYLSLAGLLRAAADHIEQRIEDSR